MQQNMIKGNPLPIILRFTLPLFIGNVFQQLYNMADSIIVGNYVGADALAAVGSTGTVMFLVIGISQGLSTGFTVLTSQEFGAGNKNGTKISVANGTVLSLFVVLFMTAFSLILLNPILNLMNTPANIFADAHAYLSVICMGIVANVFYNYFSSCLRAVGNSTMPLVFLVFSACLNVVLDLVLIINFKMGVAGAAWATNISQGISALLCVVYIMKKEEFLKPDRQHFKLHPSYTRTQLLIGIPMALQFGITASGTMVMQSAINLFGSTAVAAYTAAGKIQNLTNQGMVAMGQTMATYAGQNYGAGKYERIRQGVRAALWADVVYSVVSGLLVYAGMEGCIRLFFSSDVDISTMMPYARTYLTACIIFYIPLSTIFLFRNTMQGCGYGLLPMLGGVVEFVARLVCAMIAIYSGSYLLACFCDPAAWVSAALFTMFSYFYVMKTIEKRSGRCQQQG